MRDKLLAFFKRPPLLFIVCWLLLTLVLGVFAILLTLWTKSPFLSYLSYAIYALAAVALAYSVYLLVRFGKSAVGAARAFIERHEFTRDLLHDFGYRTAIFSIVGFLASIAYGILHAVLGVMAGSVWYGALAAYYILLTLLRGGILLHHVKSGADPDAAHVRLRRVRVYRSCGILLLLLQLALSAAIAQMILADRGFAYAGLLIYAAAAYAFAKITMAIVGFVKAARQDDLAARTMRYTNLSSAAVSLLSLQSALLTAFADQGVGISTFNTLTGSAVTILNLALGIYMIVHAQALLKTEKKRGK